MNRKAIAHSCAIDVSMPKIGYGRAFMLVTTLVTFCVIGLFPEAL